MNLFQWRVSAIFFMAVILFACPVSADQDLAKQAQNPIANLISLPLQNNTNFGIGPDDETQNILNILHPFLFHPFLRISIHVPEAYCSTYQLENEGKI